MKCVGNNRGILQTISRRNKKQDKIKRFSKKFHFIKSCFRFVIIDDDPKFIMY